VICCGVNFVMLWLCILMCFDVGVRNLVSRLNSVVLLVLFGLIRVCIEFFLIVRFMLLMVWKSWNSCTSVFVRSVVVVVIWGFFVCCGGCLFGLGCD